MATHALNVPPTADANVWHSPKRSENAQIERSLTQLNYKLDDLGVHVCTGQVPSAQPLVQQLGPFDGLYLQTTPPQDLHTYSMPRQARHPLLANLACEIAPENLMTIELDGEHFSFDKTKVPIIRPGVLFSTNIPRLFREWYRADTNPAEAVLVINGRGITMKDWPLIFKKRLEAQAMTWSDMHAIWGKWKFVVEERERFLSDEAFWAVYADQQGNKMCYQHILDKLQGQRMNSSKKGVNDTRRYFNNDLNRADTDGYFRYTKANQTRIFTKDQKVAQKWRELLKKNESMAAGRRAMQ
ncbi:hypothetical protein BKA93DRAFT_824945 [Sparassis latifolia]